VAKKGAADLLMAMAVLRHEGTPAPITVIGDGPERPRLERLARAERLQVSFRGAQDRDEVRRAMQDASVFCVPSRADENGDREGLGMVFAEAQAMGLPVVSTTSGGIPEVVQHDETGLLVPEKRPDLLARALRRCLEDAELRERFGIAGRHRAVELFDLMEQTARLERLYDEWSTPRHDGPTGVTGWS
jgi:glycosyltransferase involved in cell wall biosynthesis